MIKEFKEFIKRGNVLDMAVGIIIGAAFGKIVASLVNDIIMPIVSLLFGGASFTDKFIALDGSSYKTLAEAQEAGASTLNYGQFISAIIDFVIIAFIIFLIVRSFNKMKKKEAEVEEAAPTVKECPYCKTEVNIEATRCPNCTSDLK